MNKIQELFEQQFPAWISLDEKYPDRSQFLVIKREQLKHTKNESLIYIAWWDAEKRCFYQASPKGIHADITHWMPLPEPPKEDE